MRPKLFCFLISSFVCCESCFCQSANADGISKNEYVPASPDAASLGKFGDVPVDYSTGVPNISIPIYELREGKVSLPIILSYHAGGIKVQEEASSVGLGWSLNAGGVINRIVRGIPDESEAGFFNQHSIIKDLINGAVTNSHYYYSRMIAGEFDSQPDIFICSVGGLNFKFSMDIDGNFVTFPNSNYKISVTTTGQASITNFLVIDDYGNKYQFGGTDPLGVSLTEIVVKSTEREFGSAWFIRMITPFSYWTNTSVEKIIRFYYTSNTQTSTVKSMTQTDYRCVENGCASFGIPGGAPSQAITNMHHTVYLKKITWAEGEINLGQTRDRADNSSYYRINDITVTSTNGLGIQHCALEYANADRLMLTRLTLGFGNASNEITGEVIKPAVYEFEYDFSVSTPNINSADQDHWGFYNAGGNGLIDYPFSLIPSVKVYIPPLSTYFTTNHSSNRTVSPTACKYAIIKKITWPTGGSTEFEFEANTESNIDLNRMLLNQPTDVDGNFYCGGLRIKKLTTADPFHPAKDIIKRFDYTGNDGKSSGRISEEPIYAYFQDRIIDDDIIVGTTHVHHIVDDVDYITIKETSQYPLVNKSNIVTYTKVTVFNGLNGENGKDEYYYHFEEPVVTADNLELPFTPIWQLDWKNSLEREIHYKLDNGVFKKIQEKISGYSDVRDNNNVKGISAATVTILQDYAEEVFFAQPPESQIVTTRNIAFHSDYHYPSQEISRLYASDDETKFVETITNYEIDPTALQVNKITTTNSEGRSELVRRTFSNNYNLPTNGALVRPLIAGLEKLQESGIYLPVEETKAVNGKVVDSKFTFYSPYAPAVFRTYQYLFDPKIDGILLDDFDPLTQDPVTLDYTLPSAQFKIGIEYTDYDENGNVVLQRLKDGHAVGVIWDYNANLPTAEIKLGNPDRDITWTTSPKGAIITHANYAYTSFEDQNPGNWTGLVQGGIQTDVTAPVGSKVYDLGAGGLTHNFNTYADYYLYLWKKPDASIFITSGRPTTVTSEVAYTNYNGWQLMKYTIPGGQNITVSGSGLIDEVRLFPQDARISTVTYVPGQGVQCQVDNNGRILYYYYFLGRLWYIKDMEGNIVKTFDYQFKN